MICGFATESKTVLNFGGRLATELRTMPIKDAWFGVVADTQDEGTIGRVFGATASQNESLQFGGPVLVAPDPGPTSSLAHWDYVVPE